jgi:hypothetical protein
MAYISRWRRPTSSAKTGQIWLDLHFTHFDPECLALGTTPSWLRALQKLRRGAYDDSADCNAMRLPPQQSGGSRDSASKVS